MRVRLLGRFRKNFEGGYYYLFFSNGYVSYERPDLYEKNSRVKKIAIKNLSTEEEICFNIEDSSHFQLLDISKIVRTISDEFEIVILDIYKGSLYKDTCINMIVTYEERNDY